MSIRKVIAVAALAIAPVLAAAPASALSEGDTVCYAVDGSAVVNPANPEDFEYCVTREASGSSGGSTLSVCSADFHSPGYNDGLGSTGPYTIKECQPLRPLSG
jgi:hypothetical protein